MHGKPKDTGLVPKTNRVLLIASMRHQKGVLLPRTNCSLVRLDRTFLQMIIYSLTSFKTFFSFRRYAWKSGQNISKTEHSAKSFLNAHLYRTVKLVQRLLASSFDECAKSYIDYITTINQILQILEKYLQ